MGYVAKVDDRGRIKLPKKLANSSEVIIIDTGTFFIGIPIPKDPILATSNVTNIDVEVSQLKEAADKEAENDALENAKKKGFIEK
ncbi:VapB-type antitoxin [Sulfolobus tengchongensis]|uniref:VapB-type antitoxin n=1 Tax=Sulfolobus tengchongensis TaxID=207809 RepID=A0AAX4KYH4_9CREN